MGVSYFNGNPRAKNLVGKELLVGFAWCEGHAATLSRYAEMLGNAVAFPTASNGPSDPRYRPERTSLVRAAALRMSVKHGGRRRQTTRWRGGHPMAHGERESQRSRYSATVNVASFLCSGQEAVARGFESLTLSASSCLCASARCSTAVFRGDVHASLRRSSV